MRAVLRAFEIKDRAVWVADSFEGLPRPSHEIDKNDPAGNHFRDRELAVSVDDVKENFKSYGLLDDQVIFLKGWFKDTLPNAPIDKLAVARLDGDMYQSTIDALNNLYHKISLGGYLILDDYGAVEGCKAATHDFRSAHSITEEIVQIDALGVYWQKLK